MPDRERGYVRRGVGIQPPDNHMAEIYRRNRKEPAVIFSEKVQQLLIDETERSCLAQRYRLHYVATENTHVHILVS